VQTLVLTDIASGWTECGALLVREQHLLTEGSDKLKAVMPFALAGIDTDNDSVFINETLKAYCEANRIEFTRCRPYRKNDQAISSRRTARPRFERSRCARIFRRALGVPSSS
jgi:hypothetical protein